MTREEERDIELSALSSDICKRDEAIVVEYKRTHKLPSRGVIDTPERRALRAEEIRRYGEIMEKYKDTLN